MLFTYNKKNGTFTPSEETDFRSHDIMERRDIEKWVADFPELLGEELLVVTTEHSEFDKTKERLDLLALDRSGKLVIVELKREEGGKSHELQALKYAAYCSTMLLDDIVRLRGKHLDKIAKPSTEEEISKEIEEFVDNADFENLDDKPRIILVAAEFRPEVTSSVMWLRKFGLDISCVKLTPYNIGSDNIGIVSSVLIPMPEARDYIIKTEKKESVRTDLTRTENEYLKFYRELAQEFKKAVPEAHLPEPRPRSYYSIPIGMSGIHFEWCFSGRPRDEFGAELHFEKSDKKTNLKMLGEMKKYKDEIEKETGSEVEFEDNWGRNWSALGVYFGSGAIDDELKRWAVEKMAALYRLLLPKVQKLRQEHRGTQSQ